MLRAPFQARGGGPRGRAGMAEQAQLDRLAIDHGVAGLDTQVTVVGESPAFVVEELGLEEQAKIDRLGATEGDLGGFSRQGQGRMLRAEPGAIKGAVVNVSGAALQSALFGVGSQGR
ncbi:hypothetical protein D3C77_244880 [compost metagenome]